MVGTEAGARAVRVLILFSDTGGGHRSAAEALIEAWRAEHPRVQATMVDFFKLAPFPFNQLGPSYPWMIRYVEPVYGGAFWGTDTAARAEAVARLLTPLLLPTFLRILSEHP